jgi:hypothetical protein
MREFQICLGTLLANSPTSLKSQAYIAIHVIMPPPLEGRSGIISVIAVNFNQLIEYTPGKVEVLVTQMLTQDQKNLCQR